VLPFAAFYNHCFTACLTDVGHGPLSPLRPASFLELGNEVSPVPGADAHRFRIAS
jgi:hypothetical protein